MTTETTEHWDVCVLGAGPAGFAAAMRAHDLGKRVVLVERSKVGGAGIHAGALSSKTMWHLSNDFAVAARKDRGYESTSGVDVSYPRVIHCVHASVSERQALLERQLQKLTARSPLGGEVRLVSGAARFLSPNEIAIEEPTGRGQTSEVRRLSADHFVIATGSSPRIPDNIPVDGERIVTSDQIESFSSFPESMVVVGAGVVGCEYATMFANFGKTKLHVIDRQPRILPFEDEDVAEEISKSFESLGIVIHRASKLESVAVRDGMVEYVITDASGEKQTIRVERALVSVGRVPNTGTLGLDVAGVQTEKGGCIVATDTQTTAPHIYAAGDVTMDVALANVAELEGRFAVEKMFGLNPRPIRYEALSAIMFFRPEVASVGLNERMAKEKKIPYRVGVYHNALAARNIAMRSTGGFVKLLAERDSGRVLGLRVVGAQASSTIQGIALLIEKGATLDDIDRCVHPHPAIPESVQECARMLLGRSVLKPEVFGPEGLMRCAEG